MYRFCCLQLRESLVAHIKSKPGMFDCIYNQISEFSCAFIAPGAAAAA
jgi:hypothetical protein